MVNNNETMKYIIIIGLQFERKYEITMKYIIIDTMLNVIMK